MWHRAGEGLARSEKHSEPRVDAARVCTVLRGSDALTERLRLSFPFMLLVTELEVELAPTALGEVLRRLGGAGSGAAQR